MTYILQTTNKTLLEPAIIRRAIIYSRVSTDEQAETGTSLDTQVEKSLAYAQAQNMQVVGIFREDYTGTTLDRPEFNKVMTMFRTGQADILIAYKTNRLVRDEWGVNLLLLAREFKALEVELHYSMNGRKVDLDDPVQVLMLSIEGWQAGEDRNETVRKLREGRERRVKEGGIIASGRPPYGYKLVKKGNLFQLEIDEYEASIVQLIFNLYTIGEGNNGPFTIYGITKRLEEMGIPTSTDTDKRSGHKAKERFGIWTRSVVSHILNNETYIGVWHYRKTRKKNGKLEKRDKSEWISVEVEPIVDMATWHTAKQRLLKNRQTMGRTPKKSGLMNRRLTCHCGHRLYMYRKNGNGEGRDYHYYRCNAARNNTDCIKSCELPIFSGQKVDAGVWAWVACILTDEDFFQTGIQRWQEQQVDNVTPIRKRQTIIEAEIADKEKELTQAQQTYRDLQHSKAERTKAAILADIERIEAILDNLDKQRKSVEMKLKTAQLSEKDIQNVIERVHQIREGIKKGLDIAALSLEHKRWLIERLNVTAILKIEDGKKVVKAVCHLGEAEIKVSNTTLIAIRQPQTIFMQTFKGKMLAGDSWPLPWLYGWEAPTGR